MRIKSPLSNLSETINQVKDSAAQYRTTLQRNEAATRAVLIDPVLQALGWDTANIYMVEVEKVLDQSRVDYALYDRNGNVSGIVEAKQLGANLSDNTITMTMVRYAYNFGTKRIFVTDGLIWQYVTIGEPGHIDIDTVNFAKDSAVDCAAFLVDRLDAARFWPEEQTIDELAQRITQLESTLATLQKELSQQPKAASEKPIRNNPASIAASLPAHHEVPTLPEDIPFVDLAAIGDATHTSPYMLRLPDNSTIKLSRWKDVLLECCKLALNTNPHISIPLPDARGKKVRLFDTIRPAQGLSFVRLEYNGQPIYIYTNYDTNSCIANAVYILKQVPTSLAKVQPGVVFHKNS